MSTTVPPVENERPTSADPSASLEREIRGDRPDLHHIVVVGGGAGGLELATWLGNALGKRAKASVTLIDRRRTHLWKSLLH
jgi:hypothetical protein